MAKKKGEVKISSKKKTEFDILYNSLIGSKIEIIESSNKNLVGISGILVFESSNLFFIDCDNSLKKVLKNSVRIKVETGFGNFLIDGNLLLGTIISRIKKMK